MTEKSKSSQLELWADIEPTQGQTPVSPEIPPALKAEDSGNTFQLSSEPFEQETQKFASTHPLCILIADDIALNRKIIGGLLKQLGYECAEATDGREAFDRFQESSFDYIFMDLDMPTMSGIEAATEIRKLEKTRVPAHPIAEIIAVTANVSDTTRSACQEAGMNGYLEKPITAQQIKGQILRSWPRVRARRYRAKKTGN